ncbi:MULTISPECIES: ParB N-terminal domain-containing protein [unclassified Pseudomonas]|uniref:ParB N-terminal domain-containing protein n=1 Tax=unclassified Pseudomonas TaxID=196821 RepID=UPI0011AFAF66|nr:MULTISPECIES: ParB N-terminal domain-containing protein [unclassified Pseudomonas]
MAKLITAKLTDLDFDPLNPRLPSHLQNQDDDEVLKYLLLECNLIELMLSIGQQNFFIGEPLLVVPTKGKRYIVVEGNRRLGALKMLQKETPPPALSGQVKQARESAQFFPVDIPALQFENRDEILTYLGYRHITGIKEWDALAKARYLKQLRQRHGEDHAEAHKSLAREIGSKAAHVAKLLTGLTLIENAKDSGLLDRIKMREDDIPFSLLTTGIGYPNICKFIGISNSADVDAENLKPDEFEEFFKWVFDKSHGSHTKLGDSRHFDKLNRVVANDQALEELRRGATLEAADLYTSGPLEALRILLKEAEDRITKAQSTLSIADGMDISDVAQSERIRRTAIALHSSINSLVNPVE